MSMSLSTMTTTRLPVAVVGAGAIGRMHIERLHHHPEVCLAAVVDPSETAAQLAQQSGVPWYPDCAALLAERRHGAQAAIVATPNASHADIGIACLEAGLPVLIEKPLTDSVAAGERLCQHAQACGVPVLVGHHRRCNPIAQQARALIAEGLLGQAVSATVMATWFKPEPYFDLAWRREPGGGPVLINLIHDIDLLRFVLGEVGGDVVEVQAMRSNAVRHFAVEDTAAVLLRLSSGALVTLSVSDTAAAPWNWDLGAGEAAHYPRQTINSFFVSGTEASLTLPGLEIWRYRNRKGWHEPITCERTVWHTTDPYQEQLRHLRAVVEGKEQPLCSAREGLRSLQVALAVHTAAHTRQPVSLADQTGGSPCPA